MAEFNSKKQGNVKECPRCKGIVLGGYAKCPECGYAFMNVGANSSAKLLDSRLNGVSDYEKRAHIISSFPIPNTREDLLEFLSALEPKAFTRHKGDDKERKEKKAYYEKYVECLNKAKISFGNDPATLMFVDNFNKDKHRIHFTKNQWLLVSALGYFLILGLIALIWSEDGIINSCSRKIEENHNKSLIPQYEEWKANANIEIETYSDSLQNLLDQLPNPTPSNYEECIRKVSKISWTKSWPLPIQYKNNDIEDDTSLTLWGKGYEYKYKDAFEKKLDNYKYLIGISWEENLKRKGYSERQIDNTIPWEYRKRH